MAIDFNGTLSSSQKQYYTNYWCKTLGIKSKDLEDHPQIDDVIMLIRLRQDLWSLMSINEQSIWSGIWSWVYHHKYILTKKNLDKLEKIVSNIQFRQQLHQAQRNKIKQIRQA
jgi:hypothetical protein